MQDDDLKEPQNYAYVVEDEFQGHSFEDPRIPLPVDLFSYPTTEAEAHFAKCPVCLQRTHCDDRTLLCGPDGSRCNFYIHMTHLSYFDILELIHYNRRSS